MKKTILTFFVLLGLTAVNAQSNGIEIRLDGTGNDISGGGHAVNLTQNSPEVTGGSPVEPHFYVINKTGSNQQWRIARKKISVPATWVDQLCWPPTCFPTSGALYITPSTVNNPAPIIVNGTSTTTNNEVAELKPRITIDPSTAAAAVYRFYIISASTGAYMDSVDLTINLTLSLSQAKLAPSVSLTPNPANESLTLSMGMVETGTIRIVDVLGNEIYHDGFSNSSKIIDVSDFKNGVYFVIIDAAGLKSVNRKLIVKH
jgi:hypothetical protein